MTSSQPDFMMHFLRRSSWLALPFLLLPAAAGSLPIPTSPRPFQLASFFATFRSPASFPIAFTIQHPADWEVDTSPQNFIIITNYKQPEVRIDLAPDQAVKTDITFVKGSFEDVVKSTQRTRLEDDSRIIRRGFLKAGGRDGLRLWTAGSSFDFPDGIYTYYRYDNDKTIAIYTYYTASNQAAVPIIQQIHGSFRVSTTSNQ